MATRIVHSREDIARARKCGDRLATTPDGACYYGAALMKLWQDAAGDTPLLVGAGSNAALAHALIAEGIRDVYVTTPTPMTAKLQALAQAHGTRLHEDYPRDAVDTREYGWENQSGN